MKVMIVEDEILVRLGLRKAIPWPSLGMELACEAKDGEEALELFGRHLPDIVLVDIEMPRLDGLSFIRQAKAQRPETRFVLLTCHQDMKYMREAIQLQVNDFLLKSTLDMDELFRILQGLSCDLERERGEAAKAEALRSALLPGVEAAGPAPAGTGEGRALEASPPHVYYGLAADAGDRPQPLAEAMSEAAQRAKKETLDLVESLQWTAAKAKLGELREALGHPPLPHPSVVKNALTEIAFRAWSACEAMPTGQRTQDRLLVDRIYASERLDESAALVQAELERLERQFALTHTPDDKAKIVVMIKRYIKTHLEQEISLQEVANAFYISSAYLSRLFKEVSRMSFTEFVLYEKTELAIVMMNNGKTLTEISEKLGYLNLSSFTRMFKKVRGESPSRYGMINKKA